MKTKLTLVIAAGFFLLAFVQANDGEKVKPGQEDLIGFYSVTAGERAGIKLPADELKDIKVRIAANTITTLDKDGKEVYVASYKLDTSRKPWRISMTATITPDKVKGEMAEGLIEKDGDTVRLIYALPKGDVPTDFKTQDNQQMFTLKRSSK